MKRLIALAAGLGMLASPAAASAASGYHEVEKEGTGQVTVSFGEQGSFLMNTFELGFTNGDHKVRKIALTTTSSSATAALTDHNADDPIRFRGRFYEHWSVKSHTVSATCEGACTIPVASRPSSTSTLVLQGFKIERSSGDSNVRKLEIRPTADRKSYRVEYRDNGTFSYKVTLQYAWVSTGHGVIETSATGQRTASQKNAVIPLSSTSQSTYSVLQGFSFEFLNGDHHLKDLAVLQNAQRQYSVRFNDNNYDDPVKATLDITFPF